MWLIKLLILVAIFLAANTIPEIGSITKNYWPIYSPLAIGFGYLSTYHIYRTKISKERLPRFNASHPDFLKSYRPVIDTSGSNLVGNSDTDSITSEETKKLLSAYLDGPSWAHLCLGLSWQFIVLPVNLVAPFILTRWWIAVGMVVCILPAAGLAGFLVNLIGEERAATRGPLLALLLTIITLMKLMEHWGAI